MNNELTPLTRWRNYRQIIDCYLQYRSASVLSRRFKLTHSEATAIAAVITEMENNNNEE